MKQRLDLLLFERGLTPSREKARGLIMAAQVTVNGVVVDKPGTPFLPDADIAIKESPRFVSRGGQKLEHALQVFQYDVSKRVCADIGASTGGFTDCLLQYNAVRVYAIDVGYGQLALSLRSDPRVIVMERTNARYLTTLPEQVDLVVIDASFISLKLLLPVAKTWLKADGNLISLIKPQFEAGRGQIGKGGVVRDPSTHREVVLDILRFVEQQDLFTHGITRSPLRGPKGNTEFLVWIAMQPPDKYIHLNTILDELVSSDR
jgi:23S rRNA (cytidine1920-2'-O)/16S rRNA (cytidine1409-2'-O)-methyltransferase